MHEAARNTFVSNLCDKASQRKAHVIYNAILIEFVQLCLRKTIKLSQHILFHSFSFSAFYTNPQYKISVPEPDDDDEDGKATVVIGVMQRERRKLKKVGHDNHTIGYAIYQVGLLLATIHHVRL